MTIPGNTNRFCRLCNKKHFKDTICKKQIIKKNEYKYNNKKKKNKNEKNYNLKIEKPKNKNKIYCSICLEIKGLYKILCCNHKICIICWNKSIEAYSYNLNCPLCRKPQFTKNISNYEIFNYSNGYCRIFSLIKI